VNKQDVVNAILKDKVSEPANGEGDAFAPSNIALAKYWGKRDPELHLPVTPSLSISLADRGTHTKIAVHDNGADEIYLNNQLISAESIFASKTIAYLDLFRDNKDRFYRVDTTSNIPIAAGVASSASGFAALIKSLESLYGWGLSNKQLSILARIGSGSASRSIWQGFVKWHAGYKEDGMDSFAEPIKQTWKELRIALLIISEDHKLVPSREAMERTVETSKLYTAWPKKLNSDLKDLLRAIKDKDFSLLGRTAESNALAMHGTMLAAWPPIIYAKAETIAMIEKIWALREEGFEIYFTEDAGPNLKLLFLEKDSAKVLEAFPNIDIIAPFL
tara:strand:- start:104252 stop:105247 length:996 start_codon:yes stop_codon:yes gene_type:complete